MIRKATIDDAQELAELFRQLHEHHVKIAPESHRMPLSQFFEQEMRSFLEDDELTVLVSEESGTLTAYAVICITERDGAERTPARICYIRHFTVGEEHRRHGSGTELFGEIKQFARDNSCDCIQLGAAAANSAALRFYEKQGMIPRTIRLELKL